MLGGLGNSSMAPKATGSANICGRGGVCPLEKGPTAARACFQHHNSAFPDIKHLTLTVAFEAWGVNLFPNPCPEMKGCFSKRRQTRQRSAKSGRIFPLFAQIFGQFWSQLIQIRAKWCCRGLSWPAYPLRQDRRRPLVTGNARPIAANACDWPQTTHKDRLCRLPLRERAGQTHKFRLSRQRSIRTE
jgi:hypothetical protein